MPTRSSPIRSAPSGRAAGRRPRAEPVSLRLAIGREGIGLELASPVATACLRVTELSASLSGMKFPLDVSGGVARFRHRRGEVRQVAVDVDARAVERWAAPALRGLVGARVPDVWIGFDEGRAVVCIAAGRDEPAARTREPIVAFDVHAIADGEALAIVLSNARGVDLTAPAMAVAIASVEAVLGRTATRSGAIFTWNRPAALLAQALFPEAGARAPSAEDVRWSSMTTHGETWIFHAARGALAAAPTAASIRAREVAEALHDADEMLVVGDLPEARAAYLQALERAPRHEEIVQRLVEIDAREGDRAEAALGTAIEMGPVDRRDAHRAAGRLGIVEGELLLRVGDVDAALASFERAGRTEPAPALSARAFELAAGAAQDDEDAAGWLDRAVARSPLAASARWTRLEKRLALGRLEDALADAEHLEALARGSRAKHAVWLRAGQAWTTAGMAAHAGRIYERALRYAPDEASALAGLGACLVSEGRAERGVAVLTRALSMMDERGEAWPAVVVDLARALAEKLDDLSGAIARASAIPLEAPEALVARGLEGRWRASLGDLAGAGLAFARLRDRAASLAVSGPDDRGADRADRGRVDAVVDLLVEAAQLERERRGDALAAQRHLAVALRLRPRRPDVRAAYRDVGALLASAASKGGPSQHAIAERALDESAPGVTQGTDAPSDPPFADARSETTQTRLLLELETEAYSVASDASLAVAPIRFDLGLDDAREPSDDDAERAGRVEDLTRRLQIDPSDEAVADELAAHLEALGRGHELLALLSARMEDATPEYRAILAPRARATLERLAADADARGRDDEARLYRDAIGMLWL